MEYANFPNLDKKASRIGLGTWAIGGWMWGGSKVKKAIKTIHKGLDKGITLIDTTPAYGMGRSEEIVGKAIEEYGNRDKIIIATKVAIEWDDEENVYRNASRERILKEIDDSLKRLRTDYIDIYQVHWPDPLVSIEETAKAMKEIYTQGKIKAIGVSNFSPEQMEEFERYAPLHSCQPPYNMFERGIEDDVLPFCKKKDIYLLTYGALCRGMLSGKMSKDREFKGDDLRNIDPKFEEPKFSTYLKTVDDLEDFAKKNYKKEVILLAVRWILDNGVETALWGAREPWQVEPVNGIDGWEISKEDMDKIDEILGRYRRTHSSPRIHGTSNERREIDFVSKYSKESTSRHFH